jgi:hypothetical protein
VSTEFAWDATLVLSVTALVTVMALLRAPRRKALVLVFPLPFTIATLSVGRPIDATHVAALGLLFGYTWAVHALHRRARLPLLASIGASAAGFVGAATWLNAWLPRDEATFWWTVALTLAAGFALLRVLPPRDEPGARQELPLAVKLPIAALTITLLVTLKQAIGGFMTLFPMVGLLASYENRHGLWANVRQIPVVMITMLPLLVTSHLTQPAVGLAASLAWGWIPYLLAVTPFVVRRWRKLPPVVEATA